MKKQVPAAAAVVVQWRCDWVLEPGDGTGFESSLSCLLSFFFSSSFLLKNFCRIYSVGKGRPAAGSIATALFQS